MDYNIIEKYLTFLKNEYLTFFKIVLKHKYQKILCLPFVEKYLNVRYNNETNYVAEKDIMNRLNKELIDVYKELVNEENEETLKNIVALFGYITYFDDVINITEEGELLKTLIEDEDIKIEHKEISLDELKKWYLNLKKTKEKFNTTIYTSEFELLEKRVYRKTSELTLVENVKISNLYSEFAIYKAYTTGVVREDKLFITYIMVSNLVLNNAINLDFSRRYIVNLENTMFSKVRKFNRLLNTLKNTLAKKYILIKISYQDYLANKDKINNLINEGYSFALVLDSHFDGNTNGLILFPYIYISEESEYYDMIVNSKDYNKTRIIKLR